MDRPRVLGNRYEVGNLLGRGGMAEVHLGKDTRLGRTVAIKLLRTDLARDPTFQARFRREAQSSASLNHPAIVAVYDTGEEQVTESGGAVVSLPYIVMEYIEGRTLREELGQGQHLDVDSSLAVITGVLAALEYSHRIGIVHRDIKPANVMLTPAGEIKVMDFGIARAMADVSSTMTQTQAVIGTAQYLSPEQARGEQVDARSDLYSAGCLLYELLTGRPPFVADSPVAVAYQHVRETPIPPSRVVGGIPETVDRIVMHSLAKGREERYQDAAEFRADVEAARGGQQVMAPAASVSQAATTQYVPTQEGTRAMAPVGGVLPGDPGTGVYSPYDQQDYGRREPQNTSRRGPILAGIAVVAILAVVGFLVTKLLTGDSAGDIAVPPVKGQAQNVALKSLRDAGITATPVIQKQASDDVDAGKVIDSDPTEGAKVKETQVVTLFVSTGADAVKVPNLKNKTQDQARKALTDRGLLLRNVTFDEDPSVDANKVIRTKPAAGESVRKGTAITLVVSSETVTVPDLAGRTVSQARASLNERGLTPVVQESDDSNAPPGTVVDQDISAGSKVGRGTKVTIYVATAPEETAPPTAEPTADPEPSASASAPAPSASNGGGLFGN
jgi:beta-lactam-binding protein with PASTA domain/predicted Ser/Thr protein kinase